MTQRPTEGDFRDVLTGVSPELARRRALLRHIPSSPNCKLCAAPFEGPGGAVLRHMGYGRFAANPALCNNCIRQFIQRGITGAEIPVTLLFADIRGSTAIAERMRPHEFHAFLDRFYRIGSDAILRHDGLVDKLVGDEIIGLFFGGVSGPRHAEAAIAAARDLLARVGRPDATPAGAIPLGVAVHTGEAYVGVTGPEGAVTDFTALGDVVNATARLTSEAAAGELLVSSAAASEAGLDTTSLPRRKLSVRGRTEEIEVASIRVA